MSKTPTLRKIITTLLRESCERVYHKKADKKAVFPYITYTMDTTDLNNYPREDRYITVDIWDYSYDPLRCEELTDMVEKSLNFANKNIDFSFARFIQISRRDVEDEDENINHQQLRYIVQNYYEGE